MSAWGPWLGWHLSELLSMYLMLEVAAGMQNGKWLNWMGLMWIAGGAESGLEASGKKGHRFGLWSAAARPIPLRAQTLRKLTGISYGFRSSHRWRVVWPRSAQDDDSFEDSPFDDRLGWVWTLIEGSRIKKANRVTLPPYDFSLAVYGFFVSGIRFWAPRS
jgi:hypothetical protein